MEDTYIQDLETTPEGLKEQAEEFLAENGFEVNKRNMVIFAQYIQSLPNWQDWFKVNEAAAYIRKIQANNAAFALIYPEKYQEALEYERKQNEEKQQAGAQTPAEDLVPKAG